LKPTKAGGHARNSHLVRKGLGHQQRFIFKGGQEKEDGSHLTPGTPQDGDLHGYFMVS
jgi:hypothetical protein